MLYCKIYICISEYISCICFVYLDYNTYIVFSDVFKSEVWSQFAEVQHPELKSLASDIPDIVVKCRQDGTVKGYVAGFSRWKKWASNYSEIKTLPAEPKYVAIYLSSIFQSARTHAPVTNAFYSISWAHKVACVKDPTLHDIVRRIKESALRVLGTGNNSKNPVSSDVLVLLCRKFACVSANLKDLRIVSICMLAFSGFLRFDEFSKILFSDVCFFDTHMTIFIEKSKTDVYRDGVKVFISKTNSVSCPVTILSRYVSAANFDVELDLDKFLFRGLTYFRKLKNYKLRKQNKGLSYTCAREIILAAFGSVGLSASEFGTHSLRKGGATAASCHQVNDRLIKKHGRWVSDKSKDLYITESLEEKLTVTQNLGL